MATTDTAHTTAEKIVSMGVRQAREAIDQIDDITLLDKIIAAEQAGKARKSLIGIARLRADGLRESGEAVISVDDDTEREAMVGITLPTGITVPADMVSIEIGASRAEGEDTPQVAQEAPVEPEATPAEAQAAPEPEAVQEAPVEPEQGSSVDDCARAFFGALRSGNTTLVAALLAEVRREDADDATMAEALVKAFSKNNAPARAPHKYASPRRANVSASRDWSKVAGLDLRYTRNNWSATATADSDGRLTIKSGSIVNPNQVRGSAKIQQMKLDMIQAGTLTTDGKLLTDITFNSPSSAGRFAGGDASNGYMDWKVSDGRRLGDALAD